MCDVGKYIEYRRSLDAFHSPCSSTVHKFTLQSLEIKIQLESMNIKMLMMMNLESEGYSPLRHQLSFDPRPKTSPFRPNHNHSLEVIAPGLYSKITVYKELSWVYRDIVQGF